MRVLHTPTATGGNAPGIAAAERAAGIASECVVFAETPMEYPGKMVLFSHNDGFWRREWKRYCFFVHAIRNYDIFHFNYGESIFPSDFVRTGNSRWATFTYYLKKIYGKVLALQDLAILRLLGKGVFVTYQGDDARQGKFCREHFQITFANEVDEGYYTDKNDLRKQKRIKKFARYANQIYATNPDLLRVLPSRAKFLPYAHVDLTSWQPIETAASRSKNDRLRVVHAPTHRAVKGTKYIIAAVENLVKQGKPIELILVENKTHAEARKIYETADILVDQLLAGWYGGLAVELMALGVPVVCYIRPEDLSYLPHDMKQELPLIDAQPTTIQTVLEDVLTWTPEKIGKARRQSRAYVERWHNPQVIAGRLINDYRNALNKKNS